MHFTLSCSHLSVIFGIELLLFIPASLTYIDFSSTIKDLGYTSISLILVTTHLHGTTDNSDNDLDSAL